MALDPNYSNVVLLLHCDGANGSNTFIDNSPLARSQASAPATINTSVQKFGTGSLQASGGIGGYVSYNDSPDWWFDNGQFTIECWARRTAAISGVRSLVAQWPSGSSNLGWFFGFNGTQFGFFYSLLGTDNPFIGGAYTPTLNAFDFFAVDRDASGVIRVYAGTPAGMSVIASATVTASFFNSTTSLLVGNDGTNNRGFPGQLDDIRITKGIARYAGTIAAPTEAFPDTDHFSTLVAQGLVRETVGASEGVLRVQGLVREVIGAPGVGLNRLIVQGLAREVIGVPGAAGVSAKQYAVTVIT